MARSRALRGEFLALIEGNRLLPAHDWDLSTRGGEPRAYRLSISEAGGGTSRTALAAEVLHVRIWADAAMPWIGTAPLRRASLLEAIESALAPLGSQVVPMPETPEVDHETLGRSFRGQRGRVLLRESVQVTAAGGPAPAADWRPVSLSPHLRDTMALGTLEAARNAVCAAFGVLPGMMNPATTGPLVREAQRHLAQWTLEPIAAPIAEEAARKLGNAVRIDVARPLVAYDVGHKARALGGIVEAMATAKERGLTPAELEAALRVVDWDRMMR